MIKLFGAAFIIGACVLTGFSASLLYRERLSQLEAFLMLISHISAQIDGFLSPLERIYADFQNAALDRCGFLRALRAFGGREALSGCRARLYLTPDEMNELEKFFSGLGNHPPEEEIKHCAYFEKRIASFATKVREQLPGKVRICRSFGLLVGVMLALMLL